MRSGSTTYRVDRGFTLVEIILAAALLLVLVTLVFQALIPALHAFSRGSAESEHQQMATVAVERIREDLQRTVTAGLSVLPASGPSDPVALGVVPFRDITPEGSLVWESRVEIHYWLPSEKKLMHKVWTPSPPPPTHRPTSYPPGVLAQAIAETTGTERVVAVNVAEFDVAVSGATVRLHIAFEQNVAYRTDGERFELDRAFCVRNSL
ncbi:MAG: prepilin-type N-terminal cleavage/methylation domain-containing protein [Armatimonadetes bacterium]|nr:prepilin-type N-terminal cleavage/methylation domain-containing protein [Armatimonadota bacterium]